MLYALSLLRHWLRRILQKVEGFTLALYIHKSKLEGELSGEADTIIIICELVNL